MCQFKIHRVWLKTLAYDYKYNMKALFQILSTEKPIPTLDDFKKETSDNFE